MNTLLGRMRKLGGRVVRRITASRQRVAAACQDPPDPTLVCHCYGHSQARAQAVYGETFRRCFEYLCGARVSGDILEFGTLCGYSARVIACLMQEFSYPGRLCLYDSFEGLPQIASPVDQASYEVAANKVWFQGQMAVELGMDARIAQALSRIIPPSQLTVVKGFFEDTLPSRLPAGKAALIHVDCDLYSSAKCVLDALFAHGKLQDGCVLLCDDFNCNRANPQMGERRALAEAFGSQDRFTYSAWFSYGWHGQTFFVHEREQR